MKDLKVNFLVEKGDWEKFKEVCKERGTYASVELRRFIKRYIKKNQERAEGERKKES